MSAMLTCGLVVCGAAERCGDHLSEPHAGPGCDGLPLLYPHVMLFCSQLLPGAVNVLSALMGPDQATEVSRQAVISVRRLAKSLPDPSLLEPHLPAIVPPMCALASSTSGECKEAVGVECILACGLP
jgi:hypothetical protein